MTSDIVVHIAHKLATVKNVSVNVSDTSPRTSSTMENEDANVAENRNATNAGTLSEASRLLLEEKRNGEKERERDDVKQKKTAHRIRPAVEAEKRARRDDAFEKHAQHLLLFVCVCVCDFVDVKRLLFWILYKNRERATFRQRNKKTHI